MDMPMWSDCLRVGHDGIDACHREMMGDLTRIYGAICDADFPQADLGIESLRDACSVHAQSEDDWFSGTDHQFPHEIIDDLIQALRSSVHDLAGTDCMLDIVGKIEHALLSDIYVDKAEMAERSKGSCWQDYSKQWLDGGTLVDSVTA